MLSKIRILYNKNRNVIWIAILVLTIIIVALQILNDISKKSNKGSSSKNNAITATNKEYSVISQSNLEKANATTINNIIDKFFEYCNGNQTDKAYDLLSDDCKEEVFPTKEKFVNNYYSNRFKTKKIYDLQAWISGESGNTYKITISEDILASGNSNQKYTEEFFTAVKQNGEYKLNINNYIGKKEINKSQLKDNIEITIISKKIYMNYEKYVIKVKNNTNKDILLDGFRNEKSIYLKGKNGVEKVAYLNELTILELLIHKNVSITKEIKFSKTYSTDTEIEAINFKDIILDYNEYYLSQNKGDYTNNIELEIDI